MDNLEQIAFESLRVTWARFSRLYTLTKPCPNIILNNRLKTTAGRCHYDKRLIDLSPLLFAENVSEFENIIIPHEAAHMVAYDIYGDCGHGADWKAVMVKFGIPPARLHDLISGVIESKREVNTNKRIKAVASQFVIGDTATFIHTNRQRVSRDIIGTVSKVNLKTIKLIERVTGTEWTIPKENTCNLRYA
jgi:predicted SprT family Zn-dependent metalloprotease